MEVRRVCEEDTGRGEVQEGRNNERPSTRTRGHASEKCVSPLIIRADGGGGRFNRKTSPASSGDVDEAAVIHMMALS